MAGLNYLAQVTSHNFLPGKVVSELLTDTHQLFLSSYRTNDSCCCSCCLHVFFFFFAVLIHKKKMKYIGRLVLHELNCKLCLL